MVCNFRGWAQPALAVEQMISGEPYPIKACWIQTSKVLGGQAADMRLHYRALKKNGLRRRCRPIPQPDDDGGGRHNIAGRDARRKRKLPLLVGAAAGHRAGRGSRRMPVGLGDQPRIGQAVQSRTRQTLRHRKGPHRRTPSALRAHLRPTERNGRLGHAAGQFAVAAVPAARKRPAQAGWQTRLPHTIRQGGVRQRQAEIHPSVAGSLGIEDGEWIVIENDRRNIAVPPASGGSRLSSTSSRRTAKSSSITRPFPPLCATCAGRGPDGANRRPV